MIVTLTLDEDELAVIVSAVEYSLKGVYPELLEYLRERLAEARGENE